MFLHGDRAPIGLPYPKDPHNENYWPRGWSQLSNIGMQQLKQLGTFLKDRYAGSFIDRRFNHKQVYILSSDSDRALVSAQSLLNGFFPPTQKDDKFEEDLNWQPIAVHSAAGPNVQDPLLRPTSYDCPHYDQRVKQINDPLYKSLTSKYQNLFNFLTTSAGYKSPITLEQVASLNDLNREIVHGLQQPDWLYKKWPEYDGNTTLEIVTDLNRVLRNAEFNEITLAYLRGGYLLNDWIERAKNVARQNQTQPSKMLLYSTHDGTLLSLMNLLDVADGQPIAYGGYFVMEIYEQNGKYYTEFYYRHNQQTTRICVAGCCGNACLLQDFISHFDSRTISSEEELKVLCELPWTAIRGMEKRLKHKLQN